MPLPRRVPPRDMPPLAPGYVASHAAACRHYAFDYFHTAADSLAIISPPFSIISFFHIIIIDYCFRH
jgi:hypothetical protein